MSLKQRVKPILTLLIKLFGLMPIKNNKVLLSAFSARVYGDNPKYVAQKLIADCKNVDCVFVLRNPNTQLPEGIRTVKYNSLRYLYELATAKIWVDNTRKQDFVVKRPNQIYIQTWHGSIPFKKVERDVTKNLNPTYIKTAKNDSRMMDYLLVNSEWGVEVYRKAFWYSGEILVTGSPRMDDLLNDSTHLEKIAQKKLKIGSGVKYILYAPTFRDNGNTQVYNIDFDKIVTTFQHKFGGSWKLIVKLHPNIRNINIPFDSEIINAVQYPDIMELFALSSALITDYSSAMFDFSLLRKPVFLYVPDIVEYSQLRQTYLSIDELPYMHALSLDELLINIDNFNQSIYEDGVNHFFNKLNVLEDGQASKRVVALIKNCSGDLNDK